MLLKIHKGATLIITKWMKKFFFVTAYNWIIFFKLEIGRKFMWQALESKVCGREALDILLTKWWVIFNFRQVNVFENVKKIPISCSGCQELPFLWLPIFIGRYYFIGRFYFIGSTGNCCVFSCQHSLMEFLTGQARQ